MQHVQGEGSFFFSSASPHTSPPSDPCASVFLSCLDFYRLHPTVWVNARSPLADSVMHSQTCRHRWTLSSLCTTLSLIQSTLLSYVSQLLGCSLVLLHAVSKQITSTDVFAKSTTENKSIKIKQTPTLSFSSVQSFSVSRFMSTHTL